MHFWIDFSFCLRRSVFPTAPKTQFMIIEVNHSLCRQYFPKNYSHLMSLDAIAFSFFGPLPFLVALLFSSFSALTFLCRLHFLLLFAVVASVFLCYRTSKISRLLFYFAFGRFYQNEILFLVLTFSQDHDYLRRAKKKKRKWKRTEK